MSLLSGHVLYFLQTVDPCRFKTHSAHSSWSLFRTPSSGSKSWLCTLVLHEGFTFWPIVIALQSSVLWASLSAADRSIQTLFFIWDTNHKQLPQEANSLHLSTPPTQTSAWKEGQMVCKRNARVSKAFGKVNKLQKSKDRLQSSYEMFLVKL